MVVVHNYISISSSSINSSDGRTSINLSSGGGGAIRPVGTTGKTVSTGTAGSRTVGSMASNGAGFCLLYSMYRTLRKRQSVGVLFSLWFVVVSVSLLLAFSFFMALFSFGGLMS